MYASPAKNYALKFFERGNHLVMSVALVAGNFMPCLSALIASVFIEPVLKPYMPEETAPAKPEEEQDSHSEEEDL